MQEETNEDLRLAELFEQHRGRLRGVAYRMLGSLSDAEDAVQEAWLRLSRSDADSIENLGGWLTTVVARVCLNVLRSRREEPLGVHLPDPIIQRDNVADPEREALLSESVGLALLLVLETLTPAERLAFVLHDMFDVPFEDVARILDRSPEAARQLASRARRRVRGAVPPTDADAERRRQVVDAFFAAAHAGDSTRSSKYSTPTSCFETTLFRVGTMLRPSCAVRRPSRARRPPSLTLCPTRASYWSTANPAQSPHPAASHPRS